MIYWSTRCEPILLSKEQIFPYPLMLSLTGMCRSFSAYGRIELVNGFYSSTFKSSQINTLDNVFIFLIFGGPLVYSSWLVIIRREDFFYMLSNSRKPWLSNFYLTNRKVKATIMSWFPCPTIWASNTSIVLLPLMAPKVIFVTFLCSTRQVKSRILFLSIVIRGTNSPSEI